MLKLKNNPVLDLAKAMLLVYLTIEAVFYFLPTKPFYWWLSELSIVSIPLTVMFMFGIHVANVKNKPREIEGSE